MVHRCQGTPYGNPVRVPPCPHRWSLTPKQAIAVQRQLAGQISTKPPPRAPRLVAGLDAAFSPDGKQCIAGVVLWDVEASAVLEQHVARKPLTFPYVPGLLSFREAPALIASLKKLHHTPDALMCDGQGIAHPRRFGIACHIGVVCNLPSIGCAKSRLTGEHEEPDLARGSTAPLSDRGAIIGAVLRTQNGVRPLYVSIGHRFDLDSALAVVLECATRYRLPEPTRLADRLVAAEKRRPDTHQTD